LVGETIGSYRILSQLGAGAMGQVYLAEHLRLRRKAALKLLARELVDKPELLERFFLEARATSAIAHPGIVQIFDCDVDATGRPYIVMEYIEGETLSAVLARRGALPAITAARLAHGVAQALESAHTKGIVHRDLKPENMFVHAEPPESIKLVDFGIAKLAGDFQAGQVHRTRAGALMGTPVYMSPEQCRDSANLDARTDIYSLGCVTYEMLCGRPPFNRDNLGDLVVAHLTETPRDLRELNAGVPVALAELTQDLLRKDPGQRPQSMRAVAERLSAIMGSLTTVSGHARSVDAHASTAAVLPAAAPAPAPRVPPPVVAAASADGVPVKTTTFGSTASERIVSERNVVTDDNERSAVTDDEVEAPPVPARRRTPLVVAVVVAVVGAAAFVGAFMVPGKRLRTTAAKSAAAAAAGETPALGSAASPLPPRAQPPVADKVVEHTAVPLSVRNAGDSPAPAPGPGKPAGGAAAAHGPNRGGGRHGVEVASATERSAKAPPRIVAASDLTSPPSPASAPAGSTPAGASAFAGAGSAAGAPPSTEAATGDLTGRWEGPWNDPENRQKGRLFLELSSDGNVAGWMYNTSAKQSFRMAGRMAARGEVSLACQCPPGQAFYATGALRASGGELRGVLTLIAGARAFGQSHVDLRRTAAAK
jgi:tRNA A-37 threonylcarbamoyl transferase component Bud32